MLDYYSNLFLNHCEIISSKFLSSWLTINQENNRCFERSSNEGGEKNTFSEKSQVKKKKKKKEICFHPVSSPPDNFV